MIAYVLYTLFIISCFILILVVLLQPGKGDVASALGGGVSGAAFGPRGTTTLLAKITVAATIAFMSIAFALSIPGFVTDRSVTSGVDAGEGTPLELTIPTDGGGEAIPAGQIQVNGGEAQPPAEGEQPAQPQQQPAPPASEATPAGEAQPPQPPAERQNP